MSESFKTEQCEGNPKQTEDTAKKTKWWTHEMSKISD